VRLRFRCVCMCVCVCVEGKGGGGGRIREVCGVVAVLHTISLNALQSRP
jgi:hypothetical protein